MSFFPYNSKGWDLAYFVAVCCRELSILVSSENTRSPSTHTPRRRLSAHGTRHPWIGDHPETSRLPFRLNGQKGLTLPPPVPSRHQVPDGRGRGDLEGPIVTPLGRRDRTTSSRHRTARPVCGSRAACYLAAIQCESLFWPFCCEWR